MKSRFLVLGVVWILVAFPLWAEEPERLVEEAIKTYQEALDTAERGVRLERFRRAQLLFTQVAKGKGIKNADLFTNIGNAALQARQTGDAVLAYRRALALDPRHRRALENLVHARGLLPDWVPRPGEQNLLDTFFFWHRALSRSTQSLLASLVFALAAAMLAAFVRWRWVWSRNLAVGAALVWLGLMGVSLWTPDRSSDAVITATDAVARAADSDGAPTRFTEPLPGGTEVRVLELRGHWAHIGLADGRNGWVRKSSLTSIGYP